MRFKACNGGTRFQLCAGGTKFQACEQTVPGIGGGYVIGYNCPGGGRELEPIASSDPLLSPVFNWNLTYRLEEVAAEGDPGNLGWAERVTTWAQPGVYAAGVPLSDEPTTRAWVESLIVNAPTIQTAWGEYTTDLWWYVVRRSNVMASIVEDGVSQDSVAVFPSIPFSHRNTGDPGELCVEIDLQHLSLCGEVCTQSFAGICLAWDAVQDNVYEVDAGGFVLQIRERFEEVRNLSGVIVSTRLERWIFTIWRYQFPESGQGWEFGLIESGDCVPPISPLVPVAFMAPCSGGAQIAVDAGLVTHAVHKIDGVCHEVVGTGEAVPNIPASQPERVTGGWGTCFDCSQAVPVVVYRRCGGGSQILVEAQIVGDPPAESIRVAGQCYERIGDDVGQPDITNASHIESVHPGCADCVGARPKVLHRRCTGSVGTLEVYVDQEEWDQWVAANGTYPAVVRTAGSPGACYRLAVQRDVITDVPAVAAPLGDVLIVGAFPTCSPCLGGPPIDPGPVDPQVRAPDPSVEAVIRRQTGGCAGCGEGWSG